MRSLLGAAALMAFVSLASINSSSGSPYSNDPAATSANSERGDSTGMAERATYDDAEVLALEAEGLLRNLAERGEIPRALTWIDNDRKKFLVVLNGAGVESRNVLQFLSWVPPKLRAVAYCYVTHVNKVDPKDAERRVREGVDILASSSLKDVAIALDVERSQDGKIQYRRSSMSSEAASAQPELFHGRQRFRGKFSEAEEIEFDRVWGTLRERVHQVQKP